MQIDQIEQFNQLINYFNSVNVDKDKQFIIETIGTEAIDIILKKDAENRLNVLQNMKISIDNQITILDEKIKQKEVLK